MFADNKSLQMGTVKRNKNTESEDFGQFYLLPNFVLNNSDNLGAFCLLVLCGGVFLVDFRKHREN